jgi:hypothetical protein
MNNVYPAYAKISAILTSVSEVMPYSSIENFSYTDVCVRGNALFFNCKQHSNDMMILASTSDAG